MLTGTLCVGLNLAGTSEDPLSKQLLEQREMNGTVLELFPSFIAQQIRRRKRKFTPPYADLNMLRTPSKMLSSSYGFGLVEKRICSMNSADRCRREDSGVKQGDPKRPFLLLRRRIRYVCGFARKS